MSRRFEERNVVKTSILAQRAEFEAAVANRRTARQRQWRKRMENSPFLVDLLAETERIDEENRVRLAEETRRAKRLDTRKRKVKDAILLKAVEESNDLDVLREEKRLIAGEEKRLKALLDLEKTNARRKQDLLAAQRAERQRKQMQLEFKRKERREKQLKIMELQRRLLVEKLELQEGRPPFSDVRTDPNAGV